MAILFISSTYIGDAILSTGLLDHLLKTYPDDRVTIACGAPAAKIFPEVPRLDRIHIVRKRERHGHWFDLWKLVAGKPWRVVVDLRRSAMPWTIPMALKRYAKPMSDEPIHRVELIARTLGLPPLDPVIWTNETHRVTAERFLAPAAGRDVIALAPGASWVGKIWPAERFATLAGRLTADDGPLPGAKVALLGAESERETGAPVLQALGPDRTLDGFGVDVLSSYEIFRRCRLMIGNDSAMMHLAAASGVPTVGLFGPTRDRHYGPWGENGLVVRTPETVAELTEWDGYDTNTSGTMMTGLTVEAVARAIDGKWPQGLPG